MSENTDFERIFKEFQPVSNKEWEEKIHSDLKGADYEKLLVWKTNEGFDVKPYYRISDLDELNFHNNELFLSKSKKTGDGTPNDWEIAQHIAVSKPEKANKEALKAILKGATSILFDLGRTKSCSTKDIAQLFSGIDLNKISVGIYSGKNNSLSMSCLDEYFQNHSISRKSLSGSTDYDPLTFLAVNGHFYNKKDFNEELRSFITDYSESYANFRLLNIQGNYFHEAGATVSEELAYSLAVASDYLAILRKGGLSAKQLENTFQFSFACGTNYFFEIAKIRAARQLWSRLFTTYFPEFPGQPEIHIHSTSSFRNQTLYDTHVNMLRATTETMSSILGGSDSISVLPFDLCRRSPDNFSVKHARNLQLVLKNEAYLDKVHDPSEGSYYIESITNSIVQSSWDIFLGIEDKGGFLAALKEGYIQSQLKKSRESERSAVAERKETLLGTNQYPDFNEIIKDPGINIYQTNNNDPEPDKVIEPIKLIRRSQEFEELRLKTDTAVKRPRAWMFTYGNVTFSRARSSFARNFFACGGFEVIDNIGFNTLEEGIRACKKSSPEIVVICSSDDEYPKIAPEIYSQLKDDVIIVIAGYPKKHIEELKKKGLCHFIHTRSNLLESLKEYQHKVGIN